MTEKIKEQVKDWLECIYEGIDICRKEGYDGSSYCISLLAKRDAYKDVLSYIADLEKEPQEVHIQFNDDRTLPKPTHQGLDEAVTEYIIAHEAEGIASIVRQIFKAGAKWMAEQGEIKELTVESPVLGPPMICCPVNANNGDKVIVQIRRKE